MPTILIYPGQRGEPVSLLAVLREAHEAARKARQGEIDARSRARIPLDDSTNWDAVGDIASSIQSAVTAKDSSAAARGARELLAATDGNALEPLPEFTPDNELEGITVTMQIVDDATRRLWNAQTQAAWMAVRDAMRLDDVMARRDAYSRLESAYEAVIVGVVVSLGGLDGLKPTVVESMPALRLAGLLPPLHTAARHFLDLPPGKALRCGQQPPSI